jgi:hypothetical protein
MEKIIKNRKIAVTLNSTSSTNLVDVFQAPAFQSPGLLLIEESHSLENITLVNYIQNIPGVEYPIIPLEASDSERDKILLDLAWKSPRIHVGVYLLQEGILTHLGTESLISPKPYPYAKINIEDIALGPTSVLKLAIIDVGWGFLQGDVDKVVFLADCTSTYFVERYSTGRSIESNIKGTVTQILPMNTKRTSFTIFNSNQNYNIFLDIVDTVSLNSYMVMIPPNSLYESAGSVAPSAIYAITDSPTQISINLREFE